MHLIGIPTEQTTALTDFLMGLLSLGIFIFLYRLRPRAAGPKIDIWLWAFGLLMFSSFLGSFAHGFAMSPQMNNLLWQPLNLALGLVIALFVVAVCYDLWGSPASRRVLWAMLVVALLFYGLTVLVPGTFLTFIAYEALAMLFALGGYLFLALKNRLNGAWWMVLGILITIFAAVIQALGRNAVVLFWGLDHNGVYHFVQMFGVLALAAGLYRSFSKEPA